MSMELCRQSAPKIKRSGMDTSTRFDCVALLEKILWISRRALRVCFAARHEFCDTVRQADPWSVSVAAQMIGTQALNDRGWQIQTREYLQQAGERLPAITVGAGLGHPRFVICSAIYPIPTRLPSNNTWRSTKFGFGRGTALPHAFWPAGHRRRWLRLNGH